MHLLAFVLLGAVTAKEAAPKEATVKERPPPLTELCEKWRHELGACDRAPALMLTACAGVCKPAEVSCARPPPADYEHELCAKLAARGECLTRPPSFIAQCFRACALDSPQEVLEAMLRESAGSVAFPAEAPHAVAAHTIGAPAPLIADGREGITAELKHAEPRVVLLRDMVSDEEAREVIRMAKPLLTASPTHQGAGYRQTTRTSTSAVLLDDDQPSIRAIRARVANVTGYPLENIEPLQLVRYLPGQQFEAHNDWFDACDVREHFRGGERRVTVLIYLNALAAGGGGATHVPELEVRSPSREACSHLTKLISDLCPQSAVPPRATRDCIPPPTPDACAAHEECSAPLRELRGESHAR